MSRRHTLPDKRTLPRNGRTRTAVRLAYVETIKHESGKNKGKTMYGEITNKKGKLVQVRASRSIRRSVAFRTRTHGDGRLWGELPRNIQMWQDRMALPK